MRAGAWLVCLLLWSASLAFAQTGKLVELELPECLAASSRAAIVDSARLELSGEGVVLTSHAEGALRVVVELACGDNPQRARVVLVGSAQRERVVQLADVPVALRARTLGLALAELWRSSVGVPLTQLAAAADSGSIALEPRAEAGWTRPGQADGNATRAAAASVARTDAAPRGSAAGGSNRLGRSSAPPPVKTGEMRAQPLAAAAVSDETRAPPQPSAALKSETRAPPLPTAAVNGETRVQPMAAAAATGVTHARPAQAALASDETHAVPLSAAEGERVDSVEPTAPQRLTDPHVGWGLMIAPALRVVFEGHDVLPGAQVAVRRGAWRAGAEGFYGTSADALGQARFGIVQGFVSWELLRAHFGENGLSLGPRAAVGGTFAEASATASFPARGSSTAVVSWDAAAEASFWRALSADWSIALRLQAGYAHGVRLQSDLGDLARLYGLFAAASLAVEMQVTD